MKISLAKVKWWTTALGLLLIVQKNVSAAPDIVAPTSVSGLSICKEDTNIVLTWPSAPSERFIVLWHPEVSVESRWIELTNQLCAAPLTNQTTFSDSGALVRGPAMLTNANLADFYRVFVIPDFWFDMNEVELVGGPNCGQDFLPLYIGSLESWDLFQPQITLLVDSEPNSYEKLFFAEAATEQINFGTRKKPHWECARGLWFWHDTLPNGEHTLQLRSLLAFNSLVEGCQYVTMTNRPVRIRINNQISYPDWQPFIQGDTYTFAAHSTTRRVNWRIDVYDLRGWLLISKTGRTTNGEIRWTWNLRDKRGQSHDDFDANPSFRSLLTTWPLNDQIKGAQALLPRQDEQALSDWWIEHLGRDFVREPFPKGQSKTKTVITESPSGEKQALVRPLDLIHFHPAIHTSTVGAQKTPRN
jgi:hypothetical protein